jgi:CysZ protein
MPKLSHIILGSKAFLKAIPLFFRYRLYPFAVVPLLLALILHTGNTLILSHETVPEATLFLEKLWLWTAIAFKTIFGILVYTVGNFLVLLILTPLYTYYSERCEKRVSGKEIPFDLFQFLKDVFRAIGLSTRNIMLQSFWILLLYILTHSLFDEFEQILFTIGTFLVAAYFYGFNFLDYSLERKKLNYHESILFVRKHKGLALSIGACYSFTMLMPANAHFHFDSLSGFKDVLVCLSMAFSPLIAILAATLCMKDLEDDSIKISTDATEK